MAIDADRIHKPVRKLRRYLKTSPKRPSTEQIHDLRTNSRRLETAVEALGLSSHKNERRLFRHLARLRKRAGRVRDMDVLVGYTLATHVDGEQDCLVQLLEMLGAKRAKHVKKLRDLIAKIGPPLRHRLKRSASKMERAIDQPADGDSKPEPYAEAMAKATQLASDLKGQGRLGKTNLHPFRIKVKELRYTLQLTDEADQEAFVKKLGEVQDAIGEWHDWQELTEIAVRVLDHGPKCKLVPRLRSISESKYDHALELTNRMRHAFSTTSKSVFPVSRA